MRVADAQPQYRRGVECGGGGVGSSAGAVSAAVSGERRRSLGRKAGPGCMAGAGKRAPTAMGCSTGCSGGLPAELGRVPGGGGGQMRGCSRPSSVLGRCCASRFITSCCKPEPEPAIA